MRPEQQTNNRVTKYILPLQLNKMDIGEITDSDGYSSSDSLDSPPSSPSPVLHAYSQSRQNQQINYNKYNNTSTPNLLSLSLYAASQSSAHKSDSSPKQDTNNIFSFNSDNYPQFQYNNNRKNISSPPQSPPPLLSSSTASLSSSTSDLLQSDAAFSLNYYVDVWTRIKDISDAISKVANECLSGRGYNVEVAKLETEAYELLKVLKKACNNTDNSGSDSKRKLPPPLVRPRRHRRRKSGDIVIDDEEGEFFEKKRKCVGNDLYCHSCGTTETPEWRRGPDGCKSLCNACGLHYAKILKRETMVPNRQTQKNTMSMNNLLN